jgi:hypothetical protein
MLARPRLLERLNSWAPVTVLQAITGTGKTTLVTAWLAAGAAAEAVVPIWLGRASWATNPALPTSTGSLRSSSMRSESVPPIWAQPGRR